MITENSSLVCITRDEYFETDLSSYLSDFNSEYDMIFHNDVWYRLDDIVYNKDNVNQIGKIVSIYEGQDYFLVTCIPLIYKYLETDSHWNCPLCQSWSVNIDNVHKLEFIL